MPALVKHTALAPPRAGSLPECDARHIDLQFALQQNTRSSPSAAAADLIESPSVFGTVGDGVSQVTARVNRNRLFRKSCESILFIFGSNPGSMQVRISSRSYSSSRNRHARRSRPCGPRYGLPNGTTANKHGHRFGGRPPRDYEAMLSSGSEAQTPRGRFIAGVSPFLSRKCSR